MSMQNPRIPRHHNNNVREFTPQDARTRPPRKDSQITLVGHVIETANGEAMVFNFKVWMFKICCIVNFPRFDDEKTAPVYVRLKPVFTLEAGDVIQPEEPYNPIRNDQSAPGRDDD